MRGAVIAGLCVFAVAGIVTYRLNNESNAESEASAPKSSDADEGASTKAQLLPNTRGDTPVRKSSGADEGASAKAQPRPSSDPTTVPAKVVPRVFTDLLPAPESSAEQAEIVATFSHKAGFKALEQHDYQGAFRHFARAAANDLVHWKHPYNMACTAARAGDMEAEARLSLNAAIRRDPEATRAKARRESDFDSIRDTPWFRALID
jgi:hypothetical protein